LGEGDKGWEKETMAVFRKGRRKDGSSCYLSQKAYRLRENRRKKTPDRTLGLEKRLRHAAREKRAIATTTRAADEKEEKNPTGRRVIASSSVLFAQTEKIKTPRAARVGETRMERRERIRQRLSPSVKELYLIFYQTCRMTKE